MENINQILNTTILKLHWSLSETLNSALSDINDLFNSAEFKQHQEVEKRKFEVLLKTISQTR